MPYPTHLLPTTVVGSYPQPEWLVDQATLHQHGVPRTHAQDIWRIPSDRLEQAQDDATILAIRDLEIAGIYIVTDGEIRRESYSNRFALALQGIDAGTPATLISQTGKVTKIPRVIGPIRRTADVEIRDAKFLQANTTRATKITLPGPFTLSRQVRNDFYQDEEELAMDYAIAVNQELHALKATGVDVVQLDEPWVRTAPDKATRYGIKAMNRALLGIEGPTVVHVCFGYAAVVAENPAGTASWLNWPTPPRSRSRSRQHNATGSRRVARPGGKNHHARRPGFERSVNRTAATVAARIRAGLTYVAADKLVPAPDCGMKYLSRSTAFGKLQALAQGAAIVRRELTGQS